MLDLGPTNKEGLVSNMKVKGSAGCSDHEMVEFKTLRVSKTACSKLDFRRADLELFGELLGGVTWEKALEGKGAQERKSVIKDHFLQAQKQGILRKRKAGKNARKPLWINKELLDLLRFTNRVYRE